MSKEKIIKRSLPYKWVLAGIAVATLLLPPNVEAFLYHATRRAVAKRIIKRGISPYHFKARSRFGKGLYVSTRPGTALAEKGKKNAVVRMTKSQKLNKKVVDFRSPKLKQVKNYTGQQYDLRGGLQKGVIGPKVGKQLGQWANNKGKVIKYRSVKNGGTNLFIPDRVFRSNRKIVKPQKIFN